MNIRHEEYGMVKGIKIGCLGMWVKDGRRFYAVDGWSEVKEKQWVEVPPKMTIGWTIGKYSCEENQILKCVERYDLPEDVEERWAEATHNLDLWGWLKQFKKPCLIVEEYR